MYDCYQKESRCKVIAYFLNKKILSPLFSKKFSVLENLRYLCKEIVFHLRNEE